MSDAKKTLYERLGGYGAMSAVANDLLPRLQTDPQLGASGRIGARTASIVRSSS